MNCKSLAFRHMLKGNYHKFNYLNYLIHLYLNRLAISCALNVSCLRILVSLVSMVERGDFGNDVLMSPAPTSSIKYILIDFMNSL